MAANITICALFLDHERKPDGDCFEFDIPSDASLTDLKKAIKEELTIDPADVVTKKLTLYEMKEPIAVQHYNSSKLSEFAQRVQLLEDEGDPIDNERPAAMRLRSLEAARFINFPPRSLHVIVQAPAPPKITVFALLVGHSKMPIGDLFKVKVSSNADVDDLKKAIKAEKTNALANVDAADLLVWRCKDETLRNGDSEDLMDRIESFDFSASSNDVERLRPKVVLGKIGLDSKETLLVQVPGKHDVLTREAREELIQQYQNIIIKASGYSFQESDLKLNDIEEWPEGATLPEHVKEVQDELEKPRTLVASIEEQALRSAICDTSDYALEFRANESSLNQPRNQSRNQPTDEPADDSPNQPEHEIIELLNVMVCSRKMSLNKWKDAKETFVVSMFFFLLSVYMQVQPHIGDIQCLFGSQGWLLPLLVHVHVDDKICSYRPKSDVSYWKFHFARMLCEIFSKGSKDRLRLRLQSASCVRLGNSPSGSSPSNDSSIRSPPFVLPTFYIDENFMAYRELFFQKTKSESDTEDPSIVYYSCTPFNLNEESGRMKLMKELYNLGDYLGALSNDANFDLKATPYNTLATRGQFSAWSSKPRSKKGDGKDGKGDVNPQDTANKPFTAASYKLEGIPPLTRGIYEVRRLGQQNVIYIAKRLKEDSDELEILRKLQAQSPRCENIIDLLDVIDSSVGKCIILPYLGEVDILMALGSKGKMHGRLIKASRDVARGVDFLHKHGIAHMDIKLANLLYTKDYVVKICDFDLSVQVKDEEEQITGFVGSKGWTAPEIGDEEDDYSYSPIKADRYSCGLVFKSFLEKHEGDDEGLKLFASRLLSKDPNERPQLWDWIDEDAQMMDGNGEATSSEDGTLAATSSEEGTLATTSSEDGTLGRKSGRPSKKPRLTAGEADVDSASETDADSASEIDVDSAKETDVKSAKETDITPARDTAHIVTV